VVDATKDIPIDLVIATGRTVTLRYFVDQHLSISELDWEKHVRQDESLFRPSDVAYSSAKTELVKKRNGWIAKHSMMML
jgi:GDPmannose 4,6-dehydratase